MSQQISFDTEVQLKAVLFESRAEPVGRKAEGIGSEAEPIESEPKPVKGNPEPVKSDADCDGTIIVGLGDPKKQRENGACILNHKGATPQARSVTQFVADADAELIAKWRACLGDKVVRIIVEDLSLDTCFALCLFFNRVCGKDDEKNKLGDWVQYVSDWEQGRYPDRGSNPRDSVACLASLLGHSYLNAKEYKSGLNACCDFLWALSRISLNPRAIAFDRNSPHYRRAVARYDFEHLQLRPAVEYGETFQLMLPVGDGTEKMLVDAIALTEESDLSAILKTLLRNDDEYSWTKRGFGLLALYRPKEKGSGGDMTVSVDPDTSLSLNELWTSLEKMEDERWGKERPRGGDPEKDPTAGRRLQSYVDQGVDQQYWAHQPWYDGRGGSEPWSTLVGAPKNVQINNEIVPASKLDWNKDVLPALWQLYSPIPAGISVTRVKEPSASWDKSVVVVRWDTSARRDVINSPTFCGWLAGCSMGVEINSPLDIPRAATYKVLSMPGGLAVVHARGVTLFDEAASTHFEKAIFEETAMQVANTLAVYKSAMNGKWLSFALNEKENPLKGGVKFSLAEFHESQDSAAEAKLELLGTTKNRLTQMETYDQSQLRILLEQNWGLGEHRVELFNMIDQYEQLTRQIFGQLREKRNKWLNSLLSGLGSGLFAKELLEPFKNKFTMNMYEWQIEMLKKNTDVAQLERIAHDVADWELASLVVFCVAFVLGASIYWFLGKKLGSAE